MERKVKLELTPPFEMNEAGNSYNNVLFIVF